MDMPIRKSAESYRPNRNKIIQLSFAGLVGSVAMLVFTKLLALLGLPSVDFAALGGAIFNGGVQPDTGTGIWWAGMLLHLGLTVVVFPLLFDLGVDKQWLTNRRVYKGFFWGAVLWFISEGLVKPFAGDGFFSGNSGSPIFTTIVSFLAWIGYGLVVESMTRVRVVHELHLKQRRAA